MSGVPSESEFKAQAFVALLPYVLNKMETWESYEAAFKEAADLAEIAARVAAEKNIVGRDPWWRPVISPSEEQK